MVNWEVEHMEKKGKRFAVFQEREDDEEINLIKKKKPGSENKKKSPLVPKWVYRVSLILLAAVLVLTWWFNRDNLTIDNISDWIQTRFVGMGVGDGFPVSIPGGETEVGNFLSVDQEAVVVSNTSLTAWNSTGKETMSVQHACSQPAVRQAGGRYLVYSIGGTGYQLNTHTRSLVKGNTDEKILTAALANDGRFALVTQSEDFACRLTVYFSDGSVQYEYDFSQTYVTSISLNSSGTKGVAAGLTAKDGGMVSVLYIFDFNESKPVNTINSSENMVLDTQWGSDGIICAVGDRKALWINSGTGEAQEYDYEGRQLTAYAISGSRALLSLSSYSVSGACTLMEFRGSPQIVTQAESASSIKSVSLYGETLAMLAGGKVTAVSSGTGAIEGSCDAGGDARAIALQNESQVYLLGVSEIRQAVFQ